VYNKVAPGARKMISGHRDRAHAHSSISFPSTTRTIRGFKTRFHLYTVPGQVYYNASQLIMKGVDGVVFVADSQVERMRQSGHAESLRQHGPARA
jgi:hypothetical protein